MRLGVVRVSAAAGVLLAFAAACAPTSDFSIMRAARGHFAHTYHQCVPLGWNPTPIYGTYYPGYDVEFEESDWWLPPIWLGYLPQSAAYDRRAQTAERVLELLATAGMVHRDTFSGASYYHITDTAFVYYYDDDDFGNNPGHAPYLCFSSIVPRRVLWKQPVHVESGIPTFRAAIAWSASPAAAWAANPTLRKYSVTLAPVHSPVILKFAKMRDGWQIASVYPSAPDVLADAAAWPR
jgi:hypothetical protein